MSIERLRNVMTGEVRDVETNSDEYVDLINEVYDHDGSARPKWEITGQHHVRRMDADEIQEEDFGYEHKPIPGATVGVEDLRPEPHPERALTEAEVENGIEKFEDKEKALNFQRRSNTNQALEGAEPLERSDPSERIEKGRELAGSVSGKQRRSSRSSKSSGKSGNGGNSSSSGSGSGSGGSAPGSSGSEQTGSSGGSGT